MQVNQIINQPFLAESNSSCTPNLNRKNLSTAGQKLQISNQTGNWNLKTEELNNLESYLSGLNVSIENLQDLFDPDEETFNKRKNTQKRLQKYKSQKDLKNLENYQDLTNPYIQNLKKFAKSDLVKRACLDLQSDFKLDLVE